MGNNLNLSASQTWRNLSSSSGILNVSSVITGGSSNGLTISNGEIELSGQNTFQGNLTLNAGATLEMNNSYNADVTLGKGELVINGGNLFATGSSITSLENSSIAINGDFQFSQVIDTGNVGVTLGTTRDPSPTIISSGTFNTLFFGGPISNGNGTNGLNLQGGTYILGGANNTYSGVTQVGATDGSNPAALFITGYSSGGGQINVNNGSIFGGSGGTVSSSVTLKPGSNLSVSNLGAGQNPLDRFSPGLLTIGGTLNISQIAGSSNNELKFVLNNMNNGGVSDSVLANNLSIGTGLLNLNDFVFNASFNAATDSPSAAGMYILFDTSCQTCIIGSLDPNPADLTGTLNGYTIQLVEGFDPSGHADIYLDVTSATPEPTTCMIMLGSFAFLGIAARRRNRGMRAPVSS